MTGWILAVLALFVVQTLIAPTFRHYAGRRNLQTKLVVGLGNRDRVPPLDLRGKRAHRALLNMFEALPVFLTVALLIRIDQRETALAHLGAGIFLAARIAYVPTYIAGIPTLRTVLWLIGWAGLVTMITALVS